MHACGKRANTRVVYESAKHVCLAMYKELTAKDPKVPKWIMLEGVEDETEKRETEKGETLRELFPEGAIDDKTLADRKFVVNAKVYRTGKSQSKDNQWQIQEIREKDVTLARLDGEEIKVTKGELITKFKIVEPEKEEVSL